MREIPADVMAAAKECAGNMQGSLDSRDVAVIARAIMAATDAERERCARVAEAETLTGTIPDGMTIETILLQAAFVTETAESIAAAIRQPPK